MTATLGNLRSNVFGGNPVSSRNGTRPPNPNPNPDPVERIADALERQADETSKQTAALERIASAAEASARIAALQLAAKRPYSRNPYLISAVDRERIALLDPCDPRVWGGTQ